MADEQKWMAVFRSADPAAKEQSGEIRELLVDAGLSPEVCGDDTPGVPAGAWEVRVAASEADKAEEIIAANTEAVTGPGDTSHSMDLETLYEGMGASADVEALGIRGVLDACGIPSVLVGAPQYPNLRFIVRVPRKHMEEARRALAEAEAAGPAAAEEAAGGEEPDKQ